MRRSTDRILTTHVGALPAPHDVWGNIDVSEERLSEAVAEVIGAQRDAGVDFVNEGELTKGGHWIEYLPTRLGGYSPAEGGAYAELLMSSTTARSGAIRSPRRLSSRRVPSIEFPMNTRSGREGSSSRSEGLQKMRSNWRPSSKCV